MPLPRSIPSVRANAIVYSNTVTNASSLDFTVPGNDYMYGVAYNTSTNTFGTTQPIADNATEPPIQKARR